MTVGVFTVGANYAQETRDPSGHEPFARKHQSEQGSEKTPRERASTAPVAYCPESQPQDQGNRELRFEGGYRQPHTRRYKAVSGKQKERNCDNRGRQKARVLQFESLHRGKTAQGEDGHGDPHQGRPAKSQETKPGRNAEQCSRNGDGYKNSLSRGEGQVDGGPQKECYIWWICKSPRDPRRILRRTRGHRRAIDYG